MLSPCGGDWAIGLRGACFLRGACLLRVSRARVAFCMRRAQALADKVFAQPGKEAAAQHTEATANNMDSRAHLGAADLQSAAPEVGEQGCAACLRFKPTAALSPLLACLLPSMSVLWHCRPEGLGWLMFALMFALMLPRCCLDGAWMLLSACMLLSASHPSRIHLHSSSKEGILGASVTVTQTWSKQVWNKLLAGRTAETQEVGAETHRLLCMRIDASLPLHARVCSSVPCCAAYVCACASRARASHVQGQDTCEGKTRIMPS
jgi:hypothetical protein